MLRTAYRERRGRTKCVRTLGVKPGSQAWGACMMPLHYVRRAVARRQSKPLARRVKNVLVDKTMYAESKP